MQSLEVSGAVRPIYGSLGVKGLAQPVLKPDAAPSQMCSVFVAVPSSLYVASYNTLDTSSW